MDGPSLATFEAEHSYRSYDHIHFLVGNAKQASAFYISHMGFHPLAYRGLETGSRTVASHAISNGDVVFLLTSPLKSPNAKGLSDKEREELREMTNHLLEHGDAVWDVAFEVDDVRAVYYRAIANGAKDVRAPWVEEGGAKDGKVMMARIRTYGDTVHTLIERRNWQGEFFLPGFAKPRGFGVQTEGMSMVLGKEKGIWGLPKIYLEAVDHCVGNQDWGEMDEVCD